VTPADSGHYRTRTTPQGKAPCGIEEHRHRAERDDCHADFLAYHLAAQARGFTTASIARLCAELAEA
jgi:hypothetical protein